MFVGGSVPRHWCLADKQQSILSADCLQRYADTQQLLLCKMICCYLVQLCTLQRLPHLHLCYNHWVPMPYIALYLHLPVIKSECNKQVLLCTCRNFRFNVDVARPHWRRFLISDHGLSVYKEIYSLLTSGCMCFLYHLSNLVCHQRNTLLCCACTVSFSSHTKNCVFLTLAYITAC